MTSLAAPPPSDWRTRIDVFYLGTSHCAGTPATSDEKRMQRVH